MFTRKLFIPVLFVGLFQLLFTACSSKSTTPGLIGIYYSEPNLTSIKALTILDNLEQVWDENVDFQGESSGEWNGYLIAPKSGQIKFQLSSNFTSEVIFAEKTKIKVDQENPTAEFEIGMAEGDSYPITLLFWHTGKKSDPGLFSLKWSIENEEFQSIPLANIYHTEKESSVLDFIKEIDPAKIDKSQFIYAEGEHSVVYHETGRFAAWPANNGIWNWGDEILVSFLQAYNKENKYHHAIIYTKPMNPAFARSLDGGKTWKFEIASENLSYGKNGKVFNGKINYAAEGFALKNRDNKFWYSYSKGKTWQGPFTYPDFGLGKLTSRTDYLVENSDEAFIFVSVKDERVRASLQDRAITIKTDDGGKSFEFVGYMSELDTVRSVMPATVRIDEDHLVAAMRRRLDPPSDDKFGLPQNWIDVYESLDNGKNWKFLAKIANTDTGIRNGNPPSMVRLKSGRLAVAYGYRGVPYSIRARVSSDNGKTWSKEIILRDDARIWDIGYCRTVVRDDDKVVTVYYYSTEERTERHIAATIWDPNKIEL
ncbi:sialidase family protein [Bacteroidota bacterium]